MIKPGLLWIASRSHSPNEASEGGVSYMNYLIVDVLPCSRLYLDRFLVILT
jgi:hypothetical protein